MYTITKKLREVPMAHRLPGHEGRCKYLHGHNYLPIITVSSEELDELGRVVDFVKLKDLLDSFDHSTMLQRNDPLMVLLRSPPLRPSTRANQELNKVVAHRLIPVDFIPTVENIARYWLEHCATRLTSLSGIHVFSLEVFETATSSAIAYAKE